jgi:hypothetical protein
MLYSQASVLGLHDLPQEHRSFYEQMGYPSYSGYDIWDNTYPMPNLTLCHDADRCLPKYAVRPEGVLVAAVHHINGAMPGFSFGRDVPQGKAFNKHLRCLMDGPEWNSDLKAPLCSEKEILTPETEIWAGGVPVCPGDVVTMIHAKHGWDARADTVADRHA